MTLRGTELAHIYSRIGKKVLTALLLARMRFGHTLLAGLTRVAYTRWGLTILVIVCPLHLWLDHLLWMMRSWPCACLESWASTWCIAARGVEPVSLIGTEDLKTNLQKKVKKGKMYKNCTPFFQQMLASRSSTALLSPVLEDSFNSFNSDDAINYHWCYVVFIGLNIWTLLLFLILI